MDALDFLRKGKEFKKQQAIEFLRQTVPERQKEAIRRFQQRRSAPAPVVEHMLETPEERARKERFAAYEEEWEGATSGRKLAAGYMGSGLHFAAGVLDLLGMPPSEENLQMVEKLRAAKGPAATIGDIAGDLAIIAAPAARVAQGARAVTRGPGLNRALATIGGESALVGAYEGAKYPMGNLTRAQRAALAAGTVAATGGTLMGAGRAARGLVLPSRFPKAREAYRVQAARRAQGQDDFIPLFRAMGDRPRGLQASLTAGIQRRLMPTVPVLSEALEKGVRQSDVAMRDSMFRRSLPRDANVPLSRGREGTTAPVQDTVRDIRNFYSQEYGRLIDPLSVPVMGPVFERVVAAAPAKAQKKIRDLITTSMKDGVLPGQNVKKVQSELREFARAKKALPSEKKAYWDVDDALEATIRRRLASRGPEFLADYERLAGPYRNFLVVEDAARAKAKQAGEFTAEDLIQAAKVKRGQPRSVVAAGIGPLQREATQEASVGQRFQGTDNPYLGMATFGMVTGGVPAATGVIGGPAAAAIPSFFGLQTAASAYRPVQRYLMREQPWQRSLGRELRRRRRLYTGGRRGISTVAGTEAPETFEE